MYWYWWWIWFAFVIFLIIVPLSYGWGYRRWGPPYPGYWYRQRYGAGSGVNGYGAQQPYPPESGRTVVEEQPVQTAPGWRIAGDLLWLAMIAAAVWALVALFY